MSNGFRFEDIITLDEIYVSGLNLGTLYPIKVGALVKSITDPTVYYIAENSIKQPITFFSFVSRGFNFNSVLAVDAGSIDGLTAGQVLIPKPGTLIRGSSDSTVYLVEGGISDTLHALSFQAFTNRGFKFPDVKLIPDSEFNLYVYAIGIAYFE